MTKKVYLIPPTEKLGPFELGDGDKQICLDSYHYPSIFLLSKLGYTIEPVAPKTLTLTVTKDQIDQLVMSPIGIGRDLTAVFWQKLCEIAESEK